MSTEYLNLLQLPEADRSALLYLNDLLVQVKNTLDELNASFFAVSHAAPEKPRDYMIRIADGTNWNPLSMGAGMYQYYNGAWHVIWADQWG